MYVQYKTNHIKHIKKKKKKKKKNSQNGLMASQLRIGKSHECLELVSLGESKRDHIIKGFKMKLKTSLLPGGCTPLST
jgi:hypothetical protein